MISLTSCLAALCAAAAAPQPKTSDVVGVLAVSPPPGPGPALVDVTGRLRDELAKRIDGVLSARDLKDRMADSDQAMASLSDLDRAYSSALDGAKRDPALAISWLRGILAELERLPGGAEVYEQWTRANLRLARMRLEYVSGPEDGESGVREARQIVERVLRLQQQLKLDPSLFPKRVIALVEEARAGLAKAPLRKLAIRSAVEGAKVFVDGKEEGLAPLTLQVPAGIYRVSGTRGSLRSPAAIADAREADASVSLNFTLLESFRPAQGPGLAAPDPEQESKILQSASALGLDRVVAASLVEQKTTFLFASMTPLKPGGSAPARQGWIRLSPRGVTPEVAQEMADFLATGQAKGDITTLAPDAEKATLATTSGLDLRPQLPPEQVAHLDGEPPRSGSPLLKWSPVVTASAALALGAIALWEGSYSNGKYESAPMLRGKVPEAEYNAFVEQGASARSTAVITGVGAGVALVSTVVLGYLSYRQSHEIGPFRF